MDDLFASADYHAKKRTVTIGEDTYKLYRDRRSGRWEAWPVETNKYAELAAAKGASELFRRGTPEWRSRYYVLWSVARNPFVPSHDPAVVAVRAGMERDRNRRTIADLLAAEANAEETTPQAAD